MKSTKKLVHVLNKAFAVKCLQRISEVTISNKPQEVDCTNVRTNLSIWETEAGRSL